MIQEPSSSMNADICKMKQGHATGHKAKMFNSIPDSLKPNSYD